MITIYWTYSNEYKASHLSEYIIKFEGTIDEFLKDIHKKLANDELEEGLEMSKPQLNDDYSITKEGRDEIKNADLHIDLYSLNADAYLNGSTEPIKTNIRIHFRV